MVVRNELSYPFDLSTSLPKISTTLTQATLQIRATDTGGNQTLSDPIVIDLIPDNVAPTIVALDPLEGSMQSISFRKISVQFSERLDTVSIDTSAFSLIGPGGTVTPLSIRSRERGSYFELVYPPLQSGDYQFVIHAALVHDLVGKPLGSDDVVRSFHVGNIVSPTDHSLDQSGGRFGRLRQLGTGGAAGTRG